MNTPDPAQAEVLSSGLGVQPVGPLSGEVEREGASSSDPMANKEAAEVFTKKNRHVPHTPGGGRGHRQASPTITWPGSTQGRPQCQGETTESGSNFTWFHQCSKQGKVQTADGMWWCGIHEPAAVAKRAAKREADYQAHVAKQQATWGAQARARQQASDYPKLVAALREIEAGHNDPRSVAREVLAELPEADRVNDPPRPPHRPGHRG